MTEPATNPIFEPIEFQDGSGWYVRLTRASMLPQHIGDFTSEAEARSWIGAKSAEWLERYGADQRA